MRIPPFLIKKWVTYQGRRIPIWDKQKTIQFARTWLGKYGVKLSEAPFWVGDACRQIVVDFFGFESLRFARPKLTPRSLYRITYQVHQCERLFPGITKGLRVYVFGSQGRQLPLLTGLCLDAKTWMRNIPPDLRDVFVHSPIYASLKRYAKAPAIAVSDKAVYPTLTHEIGHLLHGRISPGLWDRWQGIHKVYVNNVAKGRQRKLTAYSLVSPSEGFAEAFTEYVQRPDVLKRVWPQAFNFFESLRRSW